MRRYELCLALLVFVPALFAACIDAATSDDTAGQSTGGADVLDTSGDVETDNASGLTDGTDTLDEAACAAENHPDEVWVTRGRVLTPEQVATATPTYGGVPQVGYLEGVGGFWIDKYEVSVGRYLACVLAGACAPLTKIPSELAGVWDGVNPGCFGTGCDGSACASSEDCWPIEDYLTRPTDYPAVGMSGKDMVAFCAWDGKQLPTLAEMDRAIFGDGKADYPIAGTGAVDRPWCQDGVNIGWVYREGCDGARETNPASCGGRLANRVWPVTMYGADVGASGAVNVISNVTEQAWPSKEYRVQFLSGEIDGEEPLLCQGFGEWRSEYLTTGCPPGDDNNGSWNGDPTPTRRWMLCWSGVNEWTGFRCMRPCGEAQP